MSIEVHFHHHHMHWLSYIEYSRIPKQLLYRELKHNICQESNSRTSTRIVWDLWDFRTGARSTFHWNANDWSHIWRSSDKDNVFVLTSPVNCVAAYACFVQKNLLQTTTFFLGPTSHILSARNRIIHSGLSTQVKVYRKDHQNDLKQPRSRKNLY